MRYVFKIFKAIIALNAVLVIHFVSIWKWPNKGSENQSMNWILLLLSKLLIVENSSGVSFFASCFKDADRFCFPAVRPTANTLYLAEVANLINAFISNYRFPSFHAGYYGMFRVGAP